MRKATLVMFLGAIALVATKPYEEIPNDSERELNRLFNAERLSDSYLLKLYERLLEISPAGGQPNGLRDLPEQPSDQPDDQAEADEDQLLIDAEARQPSLPPADPAADKEEPVKHDGLEQSEGGRKPEEEDVPEKPAQDKPQEGGDQPPKEQQADPAEGEGGNPKDHNEQKGKGSPTHNKPNQSDRKEGGHKDEKRPPIASKKESDGQHGLVPRSDDQNRQPKGDGRKPRGAGNKPSGPREGEPRRNLDVLEKPPKPAAPVVQINVNIAPAV